MCPLQGFRETHLRSCRTNHGRRKGGQGCGQEPPWILKLLAKKGCFFQFRAVKTKFHHFWTPLEKILAKSPTGPPGKNPSDAHGTNHQSITPTGTRGLSTRD